MILLSALILILLGKPGLSLEEDGDFIFDGDVRHFAVATNTVYVATDDKLYQLNHDLTLFHSLTQRGILKGDTWADDQQFYRVSEMDEWNATFSVNVLLPFDKNGTLITCGVTDNGCGYCELLDLADISNVTYSEFIHVGPVNSSASVTFLVDVERPSPETYILTALQQYQGGHTTTNCTSRTEALYLYNTNNKQTGGIFSMNSESSSPVFRAKGDAEFVDGFQISSIIYLFSNVPSDAEGSKVRLIWLESKTNKVQTMKSLRGASLHMSDSGDKGSRLLASSVVPSGSPVLWSGVFSVDGGQTSTELLMFDISPDLTLRTDVDPDFYSVTKSGKDRKDETKILKPKKVLLRQNNMTSVLAVRHKNWMVFFIGTGDGQLIKLAVDNNYHTTCPGVLYRANDDHKVFPKTYLDESDHKHIYVAFQNQMTRVPVSRCKTYKTLQECWSAQDPHCVWCSTNSCTFEDECPDSDWLSSPDDYQQKMLSYNVVKDTEQITLNIQTHLSVGQKALSMFACQISTKSNEFCSRTGPPPQFPQCTCILSNSTLPAEGLAVTVRIRLGTMQLVEQLKLRKCSDIRGPPTSALCQQCIEVGCGWSKNGCSWATAGNTNDNVCQMLESETNFSMPEISSITPNVVSFYGKNHAVLTGHNLSDVTRVRIQADMDCTPQESPVWSNTGVNLAFHIPSTDKKGSAKVCVVLPDGSCHGNAKITYRFSPSCTSVTPNCSWMSGMRKITIMGSHLEFVEEVVHSHTLQEVSLPTNSSSQNLIYDTPVAENIQGISTSTVSLKVANATVACSTSFTYYPDPEFTSFTSARIGNNEHMITIEKMADKLKMTAADVSVWGVQEGKHYFCNMETKKDHIITDFIVCKIQSTSDAEFQQLLIKYGDKTVRLGPPSSLHQVLLMLRILLIPCVISVLVIICWWQKKLNAR